ncbi:3-phosphoshikimate 1-carboxyvinyltransferase [Cytobacillus gottheilii]|uniref:3-phosphoshikimate 1-carboxyvinyltransferase n=1 Tax=Cytobacillus gottheilii TaxID=859144 RepID=A0ABX8F741_9BACI|nr:3-phosphoshikimate 1-carboxyvinyltransferase [Cytobacillus gottheilii]QVY60164.1 3-phosphoshikimate 1-carboxyvinyltransferase [Cytobacillus gottheilii]
MKLVHDIPGLKGNVQVPGDKSISHRSIMFGAIATGETKVTNFLQGDDCLSTISCFRKLGVQIDLQEDQVVIKGSGLAGLKEPEDILHVGNSGTTIRLMMGILAGRDFHSVLIGDESIAKRPMTRVTKPLQQFGASIQGRKNAEFTPISLNGGPLQGTTYEMPIASAQVKSALLFAGLQAEGTTTIIEQARTRDHTEKMIKAFGGKVEVDGLKVSVQGGQELKGTTVHVPGDISSAAFFLAAGAIVPNSKITLKNVGLNPTRTGMIDVLSAMGANLQVAPYENGQAEPAGDLTIQTSALKGTVIDGELIPRLIDEIPIIALLASQAEGQTIIKDAEELKVKETNRIDTVVNELRKLGVKITATDDGMVIDGKSAISGGKVSSHGDHRIGMMLAIAAVISKEEIQLEEAEAISVSYPNFFEHLQSLIAE